MKSATLTVVCASLLIGACAHDPVLAGRVAELERRLARQEDESTIRRLAFAYAYYMDNGLTDEVTALFADQVEYCEISGYGLYRGREHCLKIWTEILGPGIQDPRGGGLRFGRLLKHYLVKDVIDIAPDGRSAEARFDYIGYSGVFGAPERTSQQLGVYRFGLVRDGGVWKISRFSLSFDTSDFDHADWAVATSVRCPRPTAPTPDGPPLFAHPFPETGIVPFHFPNPVTGRPVRSWVSPERYWQGTGPDDFGGPCGRRPDAPSSGVKP